jgi:hypothetical protein
MPPSRQERRKVERAAAKRAPARASAAGAAGAAGAAEAAAALANLSVNASPGGDWTTQEKDPLVLLCALGGVRRAGAYTRPPLSSTEALSLDALWYLQ